MKKKNLVFVNNKIRHKIIRKREAMTVCQALMKTVPNSKFKDI